MRKLRQQALQQPALEGRARGRRARGGRAHEERAQEERGVGRGEGARGCGVRVRHGGGEKLQRELRKIGRALQSRESGVSSANPVNDRGRAVARNWKKQTMGSSTSRLIAMLPPGSVHGRGGLVNLNVLALPPHISSSNLRLY